MKPKSLKSIAQSHANVERGNNKNGFETVRQGVPLAKKYSTVHQNVEGNIEEIHQTPTKIGVSKGITKNMDNYESLRVDVWLEDYVNMSETLEQAYIRLGSVVDAELQNQVNSILE